MERKRYNQPFIKFNESYSIEAFCDGASIPYGGDDGPGIAESKQREEEINAENAMESASSWGKLW